MAEEVVPNLAGRAGAPAYRSSVSIGGEMPRVDTRVMEVPRFSTNLGNDAAKLGEAGQKFADTLIKANDTTVSMRARTAFITGMNGLVQQYRADPDPTSAPARFAENLETLRREQLGTIDNPVLREEANYHMTVQGLQATRQMQNVSLARDRQNIVGDFKTMRGAMLDNAGNAGSDIERKAVVDSFNDQADGLAAAKYFSPAAAAAAKARFAADLAVNDATALIAHNPDQAAHALNDPESFPGLDPFTRAHLQVQAADAGDAAAWHNQDAADTAATRALGAGTLTQRDLDAAAPNMSATAYREISAALNAKPPVSPAASFDPRAYGDLLARAVSGEAVSLDAADALASGRLDRKGFAAVMNASDRFNSDVEQYGGNGSAGAAGDGLWRIDQRGDLYKMLQPQPGQSPAAARAQLDAAPNFDGWLDQNPDATAEQSQAQMEQIAAQGRAAGAAVDRAALPLPPGVNAARGDIGGDDIGAAAARVNDAFTAGLMDPGTLEQQTNLLRAWQNVVNGSGSK